MPNRLIRNTVVLLKTEVTYGVDVVPTGAANALLVSNLNITPIDSANVDRDIIRPYLGGSEQLVGSRSVAMGLDIELTGSGTVATAPAWDAALLACGFAQTLTAVVRADYLPISTAFTSATIYWYDDGLLHIATGCRGNVQFLLNVGERPVMRFSFRGLYSTPTAAANPSATLTAWKVPQLITEANTLDVIRGGTHATGTAPLIAGGTSYPSRGIEVDMANEVNFTALLGGETVDISQRVPVGKITLDLTAAQEAALMAQVEAATLQTVGLSHGTVANQKVLVWLPSVQLINPTKTEINGKRLVSFDMRCLPSAGNDDVRIVTSF